MNFAISFFRALNHLYWRFIFLNCSDRLTWPLIPYTQGSINSFPVFMFSNLVLLLSVTSGYYTFAIFRHITSGISWTKLEKSLLLLQHLYNNWWSSPCHFAWSLRSTVVSYDLFLDHLQPPEFADNLSNRQVPRLPVIRSINSLPPLIHHLPPLRSSKMAFCNQTWDY